MFLLLCLVIRSGRLLFWSAWPSNSAVHLPAPYDLLAATQADGPEGKPTLV